MEGLTRQNGEFSAELAQSRQQAANEIAALRQEMRAPHRGPQTTGVGVDTRLLGKPGDSGAQDAWRDWSAVPKGHASAAVPRLQKLMTEAGKATTPIFNATILEEDDRAASAQLYWMMLTICKGAALTIAFLAGDSESLEAWKKLTEEHEAKIRTRFSGQLMSVLSSSLKAMRLRAPQLGNGTLYPSKLTAARSWTTRSRLERSRLPESQLKTHLLMRVDTLKKWTDFRGEVVAISRAIATAQAQPTPMDIEAMSKVTPSKGGEGAKEITRQRTALTSTRRAESAAR